MSLLTRERTRTLANSLTPYLSITKNTRKKTSNGIIMRHSVEAAVVEHNGWDYIGITLWEKYSYLCYAALNKEKIIGVFFTSSDC